MSQVHFKLKYISNIIVRSRKSRIEYVISNNQYKTAKSNATL